MKKLLLTVITLLGLTAIFLVDNWQAARWQDEMDFEIQAISQLCQQRLENSMASRFNAIEALASLFTIHPDTKPDEFAEFAKRLSISHPPIRALQYADAQTRITYVYPPIGNEITVEKPMTLIADPVRSPYVRKAINQKCATVQGPFSLRQGGKGIVVRTPIFHDELFAGLAIGVYDMPELLKEALAGIQLERVHLHLSDGSGHSILGQKTDANHNHQRSIEIADTQWTLSMGWLPRFADPPLTYRVLIWSSGVAFFIAVFFLFSRVSTQTRHLDAQVKKRTAAESLTKRRYRELFDEAPLMYIITREKDGRPIIEDANKSFLHTMKYDAHEIINQPLEKFYTVDSAIKLMEGGGYQRALKGEFTSEERSLIAKDGSTIHTLLKALPEMDESGAIIGTRAMFLDITDRKLADKEKKVLENKLRHAQKMEAIGTLAGGIAHDFNNILASIVGYTELALDDSEPDSLMEENLNEVYIASLRARDLVKQILVFARQTDEETKPVAVNRVAEEVLKLIRSTIPVAINIEQQIQSDALVMGNPAQIHQIILNLCTNASQAMEDEGGILSVSLKEVHINENPANRLADIDPGDYLELVVSDTGTGIAPEIAESIFEPYFTTKEIGKGTGMGLAVVHGIVKRYGGGIAIESEVSKGTVFTVYLPIFKQRTEAIQMETHSMPTGSERILFVDDELAIARLGRKALERLGYYVTTCNDSNEALDLFRKEKHQFDLIITDMSMPNMTGDKLAVEIMKIRQGIPIILCTGYSKKISSETANTLGIKAFAYKPLEIAELAMTVRKVLDDAEGS